MNRNEFLQFVENPVSVPASAAKDLEEISKSFPWFQGARILLAKALKNGNDTRFQEALKDAALHAGSRKHLYALINQSADELIAEGHLNAGVEIIEEPGKGPETSVISAEDIIANEPAEQIVHPGSSEELNKVDPGINQAVEPKQPEPTSDNERSFFDWLKRLGPDQIASVPEDSPVEKFDNDHKIKEEVPANEQLIERFIQAEPRIGKPEKKEFFSPVNMAKKSLEDREDIVSETLAGIFAAQGETKRAIRIYQKLSLLNPEKSAYFAALIKKLENASEL